MKGTALPPIGRRRTAYGGGEVQVAHRVTAPIGGEVQLAHHMTTPRGGEVQVAHHSLRHRMLLAGEHLQLGGQTLRSPNHWRSRINYKQIKQLTLPRIFVPGVVRNSKATRSPP